MECNPTNPPGYKSGNEGRFKTTYYQIKDKDGFFLVEKNHRKNSFYYIEEEDDGWFDEWDNYYDKNGVI